MKSKPTKFEDKLEKGTFDDKLRYLLKKHNGLELRKAISTLCEEEVKRARLEEMEYMKSYDWALSDDEDPNDAVHSQCNYRIKELEKGK